MRAGSSSRLPPRLPEEFSARAVDSCFLRQVLARLCSAAMAEPGEAQRTYSLEEASGMLDGLREMLERIREARKVILSSAEMIERDAATNGGGTESSASLEAMTTLRQGVETLSKQGIVLRDADTGLIDFPAEREGRLVYLCWRPDEERITHWHEVDAGFGGRKPL